LLVTAVAVRNNETSRHDVKLEVGNIAEKVEVVAAPSLINPVSPVMGQSIDAGVLERLPLASPNPLFLLSLSSGTSGDLTDARTGVAARVLQLTEGGQAITASP
jgi:hypothetical protein